ncbi:MAG: peptidoglycan DD-metalloendopeptidase family protein [Bacteroidales bacterium]|nr:peptidoglycan DD-metalloendopeptidase family protein [Bacteroidales bacterium]
MRVVYTYIVFVCLIVLTSSPIFAQSRSSLEEQRKKALADIEYVDGLLKSTTSDKNASMSELKVLNTKVRSRESVIAGMNDEIALINSHIETNQLAIDMMEADLVDLRNDYKNAVTSYYKSSKKNNPWVYILSAKDFNQGYKRLRYLQQMSKFRRDESEVISLLKKEIEERKARLEEDLAQVSNIRKSEVQQTQLLKDEQSKQQRIINYLSKQVKQLQKELQEKQKLAKQIEKEIEKIIAAEKQSSRAGNLTPEQVLVGDNFAENKGKLPWPVEKGVITSKFGKHQHPVLKYLTEENIGIEITTTGKTAVRSVFKGEVSAITAISGSNMTVIIRHGKYLSVYNNLVNVKVKKGDAVDTKQTIGEVYQGAGESTGLLKFMIFETAYLDPEVWLAK